jgi:hypothetical protein
MEDFGLANRADRQRNVAVQGGAAKLEVSADKQHGRSATAALLRFRK